MTSPAADDPGESTGSLTAPRRDKLARLRADGIDPFPDDFRRSHTSGEALAAHEADPDEERTYQLAGRLVRLNDMGKSAFVHIQDAGGRIQLYFQKNRLGDESFDGFIALFDLGDFLGVEGTLFTTRTGEVTLRVIAYRMLSKSLRPLPEKFHGLTDPETRYRQRYLDLIANEDVRRTFEIRTAVTTTIRHFLDDRGYLEVETPILQPVYGGASARPFTTHYNALGEDLYLRIADELYLKRLIIGGMERVYEFCKDFRNEGIDRTHSPEFTMLEGYEAYADHRDIMEMVEQMIAAVATAVHGGPVMSIDDTEIDFTPPWERITFREAVRAETGLDIEDYPDAASLAAETRERGLEGNAAMGRGKVLDEILEKLVSPKLHRPTFIHEYPVETSPLAKRSPGDERYVGRFEAFAGGMKFANAFTELNDPIDQRERFAEQARALESGDEEAQVLDEDFLLAMEYGMPPTGGLGVGIDRLVMLMSGQRNIREVILFPQLRTRTDPPADSD
ncbi:MAG: lysine--tRNA ligase [Chloroflexota bacterium]|nr:lysine--tRNA ligase [Chloroflexota bacterium]MDP6507898.1 lysine--tRNA ligase [Chloroflexota bacterium]MDP6758748.1 lysine--tRNA ligase [Chloroflexota bacterium]